MRKQMWDDDGGWDEGDEFASRWLCCAKKGGGETTSSSTVQIPAWIEDAGKENLATAQGIAARPYESYTGNRVAGTNADQDAAAAAIRGMQGQTGTLLNGLGGQAATANPYAADQVQAQKLAGMDLSAYMNPYTGEVENNALRALEDSRQGAQNMNEDKFLSSKAFGGSRHALQSAVTDAQTAQRAAETSAQLRQANYAQAVQGATGDITRDMQGQLANQSTNLQAGLANEQNRLRGLELGGNLYSQAQKSNVTDIGLLDSVGQQQMARDQAGLDVKYEDWLAKQGWDKGNATWLQQMIGSTPGSQTTTQTQQGGGGGGGLLGALGGAMSGASALSFIPGWGPIAGAVAGGIMGGMKGR